MHANPVIRATHFLCHHLKISYNLKVYFVTFLAVDYKHFPLFNSIKFYLKFLIGVFNRTLSMYTTRETSTIQVTVRGTIKSGENCL